MSGDLGRSNRICKTNIKTAQVHVSGLSEPWNDVTNNRLFFFFRILFFIFHSSPRHRRRLRHHNSITWSKANCETWFIRRLMSHPHETVFGIRSLIAFWDFKWHTSRLIVHNFSNSTVHDGKKIRFIYVSSGRSVQNNIFPPKNMYFFIMLLTIEYDQWIFLKLIPTH